MTDAVTDAGRSAAEAVENVVRAVEHFRDESIDDIALLVLRLRRRSVARMDVPDLSDPSLPENVHTFITLALPAVDSVWQMLAGRTRIALTRLKDP